METPAPTKPEVEVAADRSEGRSPRPATTDANVDELLAGSRDAIEHGRAQPRAQAGAPRHQEGAAPLGRVQHARPRAAQARRAQGRHRQLRARRSSSTRRRASPRTTSAWRSSTTASYEDAVDALEEATELEPVEPYMWNNLGMAYEHLDRLEEARDAYKQAVAAARRRERAAPSPRATSTASAGVKSVTPMQTAKARHGEVGRDAVDRRRREA